MKQDEITDFEAQRWFDAHRTEFIADICALVRIKSVSCYGMDGYPFGKGCAVALHHILTRAEEMGFQAENDEDYCGSILLQGESDAEIGIFTHLDVVPEGDGWHFEPYGGTVWNGFVVGRGAADNKGSVICALYLLKFLKDSGVRLYHSIRLYFGCDEEMGMRDIAYYLSKHREPVFSFAADAPFGVCYGERGSLSTVIGGTCKGETLLRFESGTSANTIPNAACAVLRCMNLETVRSAFPKEIQVTPTAQGVLVSAQGKSAHAANPENSLNAAAVLAKSFINSALLQGEEQRMMQLIATTFGDYEGKGIGFPFTDEISGKLTHAGGTVAFAQGKLTFTINIRYPISTDREKLKKALETYCEKNKLVLHAFHDSAAHYVNPDDPAVEFLYQTCVQMLQPNLKKYIMGGGTYARKLSRAVSYGPGVRPRYSPFADGYGMGHQPDECVEINVLRNGFRVYCQALPGLDKLLLQEKKENKNDKAATD